MKTIFLILLFSVTYALGQQYVEKQDSKVSQLLRNAGFESGYGHWTYPAATLSLDTTSPIQDSSSVVFQPTGSLQSLSSKLYSTKGLALGQCEASVKSITTETSNKYVFRVVDSLSNILATTQIQPSTSATGTRLIFNCPTVAIQTQVVAQAASPASIELDTFHLGSIPDQEWLLAGSNIYYPSSVGIITSAPTTTLDVSGTLRVRGGNPVSGYVLTTDNIGTTSWAVNNPVYTYSLRTVSYAAVVGDFVSVSGTSLTVSMPTAVGNSGKTVFITNVSTSMTAVVSVTTQVPSQLIGGVTSATNILRNEALSFISDGANWQYFDNDKKDREYRILFGGAGIRFTSCTSSPCVIWSDSGGTVSVTRVATGNYNINLVNGMFSEPPVCTVAWNGGGTIFATAIGNSNTQVNITAFNTGSPADGAFNVICKGPRP